MAVTDAYATAAQYRTAVKKTDAGDDAQVTVDLAAVSRLIDRKLNRFFTQDAVATPRVYYPSTTSAIGNPDSENPFAVQPRLNRYLYVDDIASTAGLVVRMDSNRDGLFAGSDITLNNGADNGGAGAADFELLPRNAQRGPEPGPWNILYLPVWSTQLGFYPGMRVQVTAVWGWPAVPPAVQRACIELTALLRLETPRARREFTEIDKVIGMSREAQAIVADLLRAYGKVTF